MELGEVYTARKRLMNNHKKLCEKARDIMILKNHDYSDGDDPFLNFTRIERMGITSVASGFLVRIIDKISRLITFTNTGKLEAKDEGVEDAFIDIINYCILMHSYLKEQELSDKDDREPDILGTMHYYNFDGTTSQSDEDE